MFFTKPLLASVIACALLAGCSGFSQSSPSSPSQPLPQSKSQTDAGFAPVGGKMVTNKARSSTSTETLYVGSYEFLGNGVYDFYAFNVTTSQPPTSPVFTIKQKGYVPNNGISMSGSDLLLASYAKSGELVEAFSPPPTSKTSKAKYTCKAPKKLDRLFYAPLAASATAFYTYSGVESSTYEVGVFKYPFSKCPTAPSSTLTDSGAYENGIDAMFSDQSGNLYLAYNSAGNGSGVIDEFPAGTTTPVFLGTLPQVFNQSNDGLGNMVVDSQGHIIITTAKGDCAVRVFSSAGGVLSLLSAVSISPCDGSDGFAQAGLILDPTESRIFVGDYHNNLVEVANYDAGTGTGSYAYDFQVLRPGTLAIDPVDSF